MLTPFDLSLRHLDAAVAVHREGSISAASAAINLSQPALTHALAKLEEQIGHRLFERHARGTAATRAGTLFVSRAERALAILAEGGRRLRRSARLTPIAHIERSVTMNQIRAFAMVERAGSYAQAARNMDLSQPTVHRAVKELEAVLGIELLIRSGRTALPTERAQRLVGAVRLMASELQAGFDELAALEQAGAGRIVVGALPLPRAGVLPEALALFARDHAAADVRVVEGPYLELIARLRVGDIDFALSDLRDPEPSPDVVQKELFSDVFYIVVRTGHPLAGDTIPPIGTLAEYPWIVGNVGSPMRTIWEGMFADNRPTTRTDCGSILTLRKLLMEGDWLALMSPDVFDIEQRAGLLTTVGGPLPGYRRRIGVTVRADWRPTAAQSALMGALIIAGRRRTSQN
ncbi:LysR family transcriptional regulator [Sphingomonas oryzagri]|uniref:LysR family transcriptional regulator n=1 Tax=Sphingomonas oryzagri TaxID=3042314 RepID=A0ABT6N1J1_9SPHN|nr:LysR family transcriptional regulator [Sphingomonas oryzagri]MDH7639140.1 LysR family transcriptional regulator [Sphingomonas oryzagri]